MPRTQLVRIALVPSRALWQTNVRSSSTRKSEGDHDSEPRVAEPEAPDAPIYYPDFGAYLSVGESSASEPSVSGEVEGADEASDVWHLSSVMADPEAVDAARLPENDALLGALAQSVHFLEGDTEETVYRASGGYEQGASGSSEDRESPEASTMSKPLHPAHPFGTQRYYSQWARQRRLVYAHVGFSVRSTNKRSFSTTARVAATPYDLLQVPKSASASDIKSQYYDLVKTLHPDRAASKPLDKKEYERRLEKFRSVVKAYDLLKDPKKRAMYDKFGMGWEFDVSSVLAQAERQRYTWAARGQFRPRTQAEWDHWHMWSEVLRRTHTRGHGHAWQKAAQGRYSADGFYGFPEMSREEAERRAKEAMPVNQRVYMVVFVAAWVLAIFQIQRVNAIGMQEVEASARRSQEVAKNLEMARENARSSEGQVRQRALMERVRQQKMAREASALPELPPVDTQKDR